MTISSLAWVNDTLYATAESELYSALLSETTSTGTVGLIGGQDAFSFEFRLCFPGPETDEFTLSSLSGALVTIREGGSAHAKLSLWYEKPSLTSMTGNLYLTSSAGRLTVVSASIFNDRFYNVAVVKERVTGSITLSVLRYDGDERIFSASSSAQSGAVGYPVEATYSSLILGSDSTAPSYPQFWGQEFRLWNSALQGIELDSHARHFESYGREISYDNKDLMVHWRLNEGFAADSNGNVYPYDSTTNVVAVTGSNFVASQSAYTKFLENFGYIPGIDYGWNQEKIRTYDSSIVPALDRYEDEKFVSLEFNMYDALNEDITHVMSSYDELGNVLGLPVNRYREEYEGLQQMRETYFKRLQGKLNFRVFADMLDFFDTSFVSVVEKVLPARALFKGDELVVESHMLERPKYQYQLRPIREGVIDISGSINMTSRFD